MYRASNCFWLFLFIFAVMALLVPQAPVLRADSDGGALQVDEEVPETPEDDEERPPPPVALEAVADPIDEASLEARLFARLRHQMHVEVDDIALRSMEQAMRQLHEREGTVKARRLGKELRLTFRLEPPLDGAGPVSVLTRTASYSAFADTVLAGNSFRLNVAGDINLQGLRGERVLLDFSTLLQYGDADQQESGSGGATGSAELLIGEPEVILSLGARDLVLTVTNAPVQR